MGKTKTLRVHHAFWSISLPSLHGYDYEEEMPNFTFYGERKQLTAKIEYGS